MTEKSFPRTLADIDPSARVEAYGAFWSSPLNITPQANSEIVRLFALWSWIDAALTNTVAGLLRADFVVVADMLSALRSARISAIRAAAKSALEPADRKLFNGCLDTVYDVRKWTRDLYAHSIWVESDIGTDYILLVDPSRIVRLNAQLHKIASFLDNIDERSIGELDIDDLPEDPGYIDPKDVIAIHPNEVRTDSVTALNCITLTEHLSSLGTESATEQGVSTASAIPPASTSAGSRPGVT